MMTKKKDNDKKITQQDETSTINEESIQNTRKTENSLSYSEVELLLQKLEENHELKNIIISFDEKSTDLKLKDILELNNKLLSEIKTVKQERNDYLTILQRFKADFENYKKRSEKQTEADIKFSSERIISKIFEPIEDISRVIIFAHEQKQESVPLEGIEIIFNKLSRVLEDEGTIIIAPKQGEIFDPRYHEAVCVDSSDNYEPGKVVQLLEKGYKMKDKVLRAAKVMVSIEKGNPIEEEEINNTREEQETKEKI